MDQTGRTNIQIGHIIRTISGRDTGKLAVVVAIIDENKILLADGDKRKVDKPKQKNIRHIKLETEQVITEVVEAIQTAGKVSNSRLRYVLDRYRLEQLDPPKKGV